jgi:elongation factor 1-delta
MANISLLILDSFAFTLESLKQVEAEAFYYQQLGSGAITEEDLAMREENTKLKKQVDDLENQVKQLKDRVTKLELAVGSGKGVVAPVKSSGDSKPPAKADDDDDVDLFGSDEEDEDAAKVREQRLADYAAKKSKKPTIVAKSNVILDVKPWDDETDMGELEKHVRTIVMDGLLWGASKLVPLAYGIKKLQIATVIEDDKVSVDELTEKIEAFEDFVQSVDIAAFNKI